MVPSAPTSAPSSPPGSPSAASRRGKSMNTFLPSKMALLPSPKVPTAMEKAKTKWASPLQTSHHRPCVTKHQPSLYNLYPDISSATWSHQFHRPCIKPPPLTRSPPLGHRRRPIRAPLARLLPPHPSQIRLPPLPRLRLQARHLPVLEIPAPQRPRHPRRRAALPRRHHRQRLHRRQHARALPNRLHIQPTAPERGLLPRQAPGHRLAHRRGVVRELVVRLWCQ